MSKLALGTVQFGLTYGIANRSGQVNLVEGKKILDLASKAGINTLDTAISYGVSEDTLGRLGIQNFNVVSKLPGLPESCCEIDSWVDEQVIASLKRLRVSMLNGLLLHKTADLLGHSGKNLMNAINRVKSEGLVQNVGVSIYDPSELDIIMNLMRIDLVQCPLSVIDRRIETSGWLSLLHKDGVKIHTRSAFLQGLLLMPRSFIPSKFQAWGLLWDKWHAKLKEVNISPVEASLSYPLSLPEVERVVVGVDSSDQLETLIEASQAEVPKHDFSCMSLEDQALINPSNWSSL